MSEILYSDKAPAPAGPYSLAVKTGNLIFLSGQIAPEATGENKHTAQTKKILENIRNILESFGLSMENVIKTTLYVRDLSQFSNINTVYAEYFQSKPPARSCVEVTALPKGALVEIELVAETSKID